MSELRDAFDGLAAEAPTADGPSPDALWRRGRHRQRRRRGLTGLVAVLVVGLGALVGGGQLSGPDRTPSVAVTPETELAVPLSLWPAPGTLPGTGEMGIPGRIAAMWRDDRVGLLGARPAWVAVSAVDGSYRFLDEMPGDATQVTLSPDGRFVAWAQAEEIEAARGPVAVGWRLYDAQTGRVLQRDLREGAPYGVKFDIGPAAPVWTSDSRRLAYGLCVNRQYDAELGDMCNVEVQAWDVLSGRVTPLRLPPDEQVVGREGAQLIAAASAYEDEPVELRLRLVDPRTGDVAEPTRIDEVPMSVQALVSPPTSSRYLLVGQAQVRESDGVAGLRFGIVESGAAGPASAPFLFPPTEQVLQTVGPIPVPGGTGVAVVTALRREDHSGTTYRLRSWDADGGITDQVQTQQGFNGRDLLIAADPVAAGAFVDANRAPSGGTDPRILAAVFLGVVLAAAALWWRRRSAA